MTKRTMLIILLSATVLLSLLLTFNVMNSATKSNSQYSDALLTYKTGDYAEAYFKFSKISDFSGLKSAALFRQARCAGNLQHYDVALKYYKKIIIRYPKSNIALLSRYNMALIQYDMNNKNAKHNFELIIKSQPESELANISEYFLGLIKLREAESVQNKTKKELTLKEAADYFKTYLKKNPDGKYAKDAVENLINTNIEFSSGDNLLIGKAYYNLGKYEDAKKYLDLTDISESWTALAKNSYKLKDYAKVKYFTETGLKNYSNSVDVKDIYTVIDYYLTLGDSKETAVKHLIANISDCNGFDYIMHLNCGYKKGNTQIACYTNLYKKYPTGQFTANALSEVFYSKVKSGKYIDAKELGRIHLRSFSNCNSAPFVMYNMGNVEKYLKNYDSSNSYYKSVLSKYPDNYYAYRAFLNLNKNASIHIKSDIKNKPVVFPYKKSHENDLAVKLALLSDYDLVDELCKNDKFVQSWLAYRKGDYTVSAIMARNAMESLTVKPPFSDYRWRLVYPIHYFEEITRFSRDNNPVLLLSIMKEESHFNPNAVSSAGALGLMQLMPATAEEVAKSYCILGDYSTPETNIKLASIYFSNIKQTLGGKSALAVLAYNGGYNAVNRWKEYLNYDNFDDFVEKIPYGETKMYLKKVLRTYWNYTNIY